MNNDISWLPTTSSHRHSKAQHIVTKKCSTFLLQLRLQGIQILHHFLNWLLSFTGILSKQISLITLPNCLRVTVFMGFNFYPDGIAVDAIRRNLSIGKDRSYCRHCSVPLLSSTVSVAALEMHKCNGCEEIIFAKNNITHGNRKTLWSYLHRLQ